MSKAGGLVKEEDLKDFFLTLEDMEDTFFFKESLSDLLEQIGLSDQELEDLFFSE